MSTTATVTRTTPVCMGCNRSSTVELTPAEDRALGAGRLLQDALPDREPSFRELVKTGIHPQCWERMFGDDDEEELPPALRCDLCDEIRGDVSPRDHSGMELCTPCDRANKERYL